ncbi:hypothetical protein GUJ93_ZPchr0011g28062 [Zizania palustris]|uniref:Uncharacterized protein n=1 Tax=Zizania palustris TaxID=103762 RepID=A0A8J5WJW9_ZIZPA|nr:hypothetical protein GUJ93_ZPchr0011g28062 [Zizania palustris]
MHARNADRCKSHLLVLSGCHRYLRGASMTTVLASTASRFQRPLTRPFLPPSARRSIALVEVWVWVCGEGDETRRGSVWETERFSRPQEAWIISLWKTRGMGREYLT